VKATSKPSTCSAHSTAHYATTAGFSRRRRRVSAAFEHDPLSDKPVHQRRRIVEDVPPQSSFLTGQRSGADTAWGHIQAENQSSMRTAQKPGRRALQQEYFVSLSAH
jgi:hypothetical protein